MQKEDTKFSAQGGPASGWDIAVIGGGPAGMMAALTAAETGARVILIEKNKQLGKKFLLTGNGRCNITNAEFNLRELVKNYENGEFLFHAFSVFGPERTIGFFNKLGVETKTEDNNRVFPKGNNAEDVLDILKNNLRKNNVEIISTSEVIDIVSKGKKIIKLIMGDREIIADKYVLCTGGKSYSATGSDGLGYKLAEKLGHTIVRPMPALAPMTIHEEWVKSLSGISLENVKITVSQNGKKQFQETGEIIFTHFGVSGPVVLNISGRVGDLLKKGGTKIAFDLFPQLNHEEVAKEFEDILVRHLNRTVKNVLSFLVPERMAEILSDIAKVDKNKIANNMSKVERASIAKILKNIEVTVTGVLSFDLAQVTKGGVSLKEINDKTMKSKIIDNLFFAGEIIDINGKTGGFNLQECWSTGYLAGKSSTIF